MPYKRQEMRIIASLYGLAKPKRQPLHLPRHLNSLLMNLHGNLAHQTLNAAN
jgi:hypothetical protein